MSEILDSDKISNVDFQKVGQAAMAVITKLQDYRPEVRVAGAAYVFLELTRHYNMRPARILEVTGRLRQLELAHSKELRAVRSYISKEMGR